MKTNLWWLGAAVVWGGVLLTDLQGAETATVKAKTVNVRGQPTIYSEVVTQLKEGETVTVLEKVTIKKPKPDEPAEWARIRIPLNTPVWVNASYLDASNHTVKPPKLNVRAGPGENYSVIGLLRRDEEVKPIRTVGAWTEIESPTNCFAFVASELLTNTVTAAAPAVVASTATNAPAITNEPPVKPEAPPTTTETVKTEPPPLPAEAPTNTVAAPPAITNIAAADKAEPPSMAAPSLANPPTIAPPPIAPATPPKATPPPRRVVRREGIVSGFVSIVAPADFELKNVDNGRVMDYLQSTTTNIVLKKYRGKRVVVSGEEIMDERWPETPVLKVETLEIAP